MSAEKVDVIIVGSGVAGLSAAISFARQGVQTLVIEKNSQIGLKIRGEVINLHNPIYKKLLGTEISKEYIEVQYEKAYYYTPSCKKVAKRDLTKDIIKVNINYRLFIEHLAKVAIECGAKILLNAEVTELIRSNDKICGVQVKHFNSSRKFEAQVIIGADGHYSKIRELAGLPAPKGLQLMIKGLAEGVKCDEKRLEFFLLSDPPSVLWIFPKSNTLAEVGCTLWAPFAPKQDKEALMEVWNRNLKEHPLFKDVMADAEFLYFDFDGLPFGGPQKKHYCSHVFMIGDAAGQVMAVGGSGIISSMSMGSMTGEELGSILKEKGNISEEDLIRCSEVIRKSEVGKKLVSERKVATMLRDVVYNVLKTPEEIDANFDKLEKQIANR